MKRMEGIVGVVARMEGQGAITHPPKFQPVGKLSCRKNFLPTIQQSGIEIPIWGNLGIQNFELSVEKLQLYAPYFFDPRRRWNERNEEQSGIESIKSTNYGSWSNELLRQAKGNSPDRSSAVFGRVIDDVQCASSGVIDDCGVNGLLATPGASAAWAIAVAETMLEWSFYVRLFFRLDQDGYSNSTTLH